MSKRLPVDAAAAQTLSARIRPSGAPTGRSRPGIRAQSRREWPNTAAHYPRSCAPRGLLLGRGGKACFVWPSGDLTDFLAVAASNGLHAKRLRFVHASPGRAAHRVLAELKARSIGRRGRRAADTLSDAHGAVSDELPRRREARNARRPVPTQARVTGEWHTASMLWPSGSSTNAA